MNAAELRTWLLERLHREVEIPLEQIDPAEPFSSYGLESVTAATISGELEELLGRRLEPVLLFEHPTIDALVDFLTREEHPTAGPDPSTAGEPASNEPIAIVGLGCRFPGARGPEAFWELLLAGRDAISEVPPDRFDLAELYDPEPLAPGKVSSRWGGFLADVDGFDYPYFGISFDEAEAMDPQQRHLLEVAVEALEDAGIAPARLAGSTTGVFVGISHNDYERAHMARLEHVGGFSGTGNALSVAANRISYRLDLRGPSLAVDTACSSSLVAVHLAVESLRRGECTSALAGGANVILSPEATIAFSKAGMMAADGRCKTFDARADGYVRGEGVGFVVLKPLSAAVRDGDPIHAVIRGSGVTQDGRTNGLSAPNPGAQEAVLRAAYAAAGVRPSEVGYIEAHGTGTLLGDPIEATALGRVVGAGRGDGQACWLGSVKTNIGHLEAAAGIAGLIKTALVVEHRTAPPSLHFEEPNPKIDFPALGLQVPTLPQPLAPAAADRPLRAGVSAFGFGGTNCHVVLEEPPARKQPREMAGPHVLPLSASHPQGLREIAEALGRRLAAGEEGASLYDLARGLADGRDHRETRLALVCDDLEDLRGKLASAQLPEAPRRRKGAPRVAFVFSGQGSQYAGMGRELFGRYDDFDRALRACDDLLQPLLGGSILDEMLRDPEASRLEDTAIAQPSIAALGIALTDFLRTLGITPDAVAGHSIGEIPAAYAAGALTRPQALRVAVERGRAMSGVEQGGAMLSVPLAAAEIEERLSAASELSDLEVAAENASELTVVSGPKTSLETLYAALEAEGIVARWLRVAYAFHSRQMDEAAARLPQALDWLEPRRPACPFYSTVQGGRLDADARLDGTYWGANVRQRVRFSQAVHALADDGFEVMLEVGADPVLSSALRSLAPESRQISTLSHKAAADRAFLEATAGLYSAGVEVRWEPLFAAPAQPVSLPLYPWWRDDALAQARAKAQRRSRRGGAPAKHPLLGSEITPGLGAPLRVWSREISLDELPLLMDHQVKGSVLFPAAGFFEIFLAAARETLGTHLFELKNLHIPRPLILDPQEETTLLVKLEEDGAASRLALYARNGTDGDWSPYADAQVAPSSRREAPERPLDDSLGAIQSRCLETIPKGQLYERLAEVGLEYGPAFRPVKEVWRQDGEALAGLKAPDAAGSLAPYLLHPVLLDGGFQTIAAALPDLWGQPSLRLPESLESLHVFGSSREIERVHVRLREGDPEDPALARVDLWLLHRDGGVVVEALGLGLRALHASEIPSEASQASDIGHWIYRDDWEPTGDLEAPAEARSWLLFADAKGVGERLAASLAASGDGVTLVRSGDSLEIGPGDEHTVNPHDPAAVDEAVKKLLGIGSRPVDGILCLWGIDQPVPGDGETPQLPPRSTLAVAHLVRSLVLNAALQNARLWLVTEGAQALTPAQWQARPWQAPIWGLGFAVAMEYPDLACSRLDLDPQSSVGDKAAANLAAFLRAAPDGDQFAQRDDRLFQRRLTYLEAEAPRETFDIVPDGTYLVTGGWGALGLTVTTALVASGATHLVLVGRSQPNEDAHIVLEGLGETGARIETRSVDVADGPGLAAVLDELRRELPPLRGLVHAAGVLDDGPLLDLDGEQLARVMAPKALGAWNLHQLTQEDPLDFFVLFSSAASSLGSIGQSAYMAANAFLDTLAEKRARAGQPALAINWGPWADAGMAAEASSQERGASVVAGVSMIEPRAGAQTFVNLLGTLVPRVMVLPYDLRQLLHIYPASQGLALFERLFGDDLHQRRSMGSKTGASPRPSLIQEYIEPRNELEAVIAGIWQRALSIDRVGIRDPFFELGGDSVVGGQILTQVNKTLSVILDSQRAFTEFTVESLAQLAEEALAHGGTSPPREEEAASPAQSANVRQG